VLLDIGSHDPLLPSGEAAASARLLDARRSRIETHQLMRQDDAKRLEIRAAVRVGALDQRRQLECGIPKGPIFEMEPRREVRQFRLGERDSGRIEIEIRHARQEPRLMPFVVFVAGRHEGELPAEIALRRSRQTLDECLAVLAIPCSQTTSKWSGPQ